MNSVYLITNKVTGKYYVGQTTMSIEERFKWHCYYKPNKELHKDIFEYGKGNFSIETLCVCPTSDDMDKAEKFFIEFMGSSKKSFGYNKAKGGGFFRPTASMNSNDIVSFLEKKMKNKAEFNYFVNYQLFKMPYNERRTYEGYIKKLGYRI